MEEQFYENCVEEVAFCEGGYGPLEKNRTGELAMECWNLRKTVLEQTAQSVKLKKEIKTLKNLIKSLQRSVSDCEAESLAKSKDIHTKKTEILQGDKKIHELTQSNNILNSSFQRSKKQAIILQRKLDEAAKENGRLEEKCTAIGQSVKDELRAQESIFSLEIRKISEERDRAVRDVNVQKTFVDEASERVNDLDATCRELRLQLEMQSSQHSESLARIAKEQEHAHDALHARLETMWSEREALCRRLVMKEYENHQLMSFILMEGIQLPELLPAPQSLFNAVSQRYPAGASRFTTADLTDSSGGTIGQESDGWM